jgi:hypothetical protein
MNEIKVWITCGRILRGKNRSTEREICPPKTQTEWPGIEPTPYRERLAINYLSHNTVHPVTCLSAYGIYLHDLVSNADYVTKTCIIIIG